MRKHLKPTALLISVLLILMMLPYTAVSPAEDRNINYSQKVYDIGDCRFFSAGAFLRFQGDFSY